MMSKAWLKQKAHFLILLVLSIPAVLLIFAPQIPQWDERHTGDLQKGTLELRVDNIIEQSFTWEYPVLDTVAIWLVPNQALPAQGGLHLEVSHNNQSQAARLAFADIPPSGIAVFTFAAPLQQKNESHGVLRIGQYDNSTPVYFQYQRDDNKYRGGKLTFSQGDLAFQLRYKRPALNTARNHWLYATALFIAALVVALFFKKWRPSLSQSNFTKHDWLIVLGFLVAITLWYLWFFSQPGFWLGPGDFVKDVGYLQSSAQAFKQGSWPAWSHLTCGGLPLLGNPESNSLSVGALLALWLSAEKALWVMLALEAGIAAAGTYLLARATKASIISSIAATGVASLSSAYAYKIIEGFTMLGGALAFTPWVLLGALLAERDRSIGWLWISGSALGLMFLRGDVHVIAVVIIVLAAVTTWSALQQRSWRPVFVLLGIGAVAFLWGSIKIVAHLEQPALFKEEFYPYVAPLISSGWLDEVFLHAPDRNFKVPVLHGARTEHWGNFGAYIGILSLTLAAIGLIRQFPARGWIVIVAISSLVISEGQVYETILRHIPFVDGLLRMPTRFLTIFMVAAGVLLAHGVDTVGSFFTAQLRRVVVVALATAVLLDLGVTTAGILATHLWQFSANAVPTANQPTLVPHANFSRRDALHPNTLLHSGYLLPHLCADFNQTYAFAESIQKPTTLAEVPATLTANTVTIKPRSGPADITINEHFVSAWIADQGVALANDQEAIQVIVPKNAPETITLKYVSGATRVEQALLITLLLVSAMIFGIYVTRKFE